MVQLLSPYPTPTRVRPRPGAIVDILCPAPRDIWRGVLRDDPGATAQQTPEYLDAVVAATGGTDVSRFYQLRDGRQLVLPLVRRRSWLGLHLDAGYPGAYGPGGMLATGGLLADDVAHGRRGPAGPGPEHSDRRRPSHRRTVVGRADAWGDREPALCRGP